ncbi:MAG: ankyrin repeat domain-containing protein [Candidatus Latescibacteria bacterium]|nr:ankyrin repeat domain-containing protein [Candidatus Latescibacterota bacterium]
MDTLPLPARPNLPDYTKLAEGLTEATRSENASAVKGFCNDWLGEIVRVSGPDLTDFVQGSWERAIGEVEKAAIEMSEKAGDDGEGLTLAGAQFLIARAHSFESWDAFARFVEKDTRETDAGAEFEIAADAVVDGDLPTLEALLRANPALAHAHSARIHRATLLYYLAANGIEDFRQRSPANAPEIARRLLDAGAEVDALCGPGDSGDTPMLALVTSVHPHYRGVATELIEIFVEAGSKVDGVKNDGAPVRLALKFGYPESAAALVRLGAEVKNVAMAAGLGRLDLTTEFVEERGVSEAELAAAFEDACRFGRTDIAEYLLGKGVDVDEQATWKMTGLMWAASQGHPDTMDLILDHGPLLELRNEFGGTAMGTTLHFAINLPRPGADYPAVIDRLLNAGLKFEGTRKGTGLDDIDAVLRRHGKID